MKRNTNLLAEAFGYLKDPLYYKLMSPLLALIGLYILGVLSFTELFLLGGGLSLVSAWVVTRIRIIKDGGSK